MGDLTLQGTADKTINANISGTTNADGMLTVSGGTLTGNVTANNTLEITGGTIDGNVTANGDLTMSGGSFNGKIDANADVTATGGIVSELWMNTADSQITLDANIGGSIKISTSLTGTIYITGTETGTGHTYNDTSLSDSRFTWGARP